MTEYKKDHDYEDDQMCENDCGEYATEDSGLCEECDLATYDCKECNENFHSMSEMRDHLKKKHSYKIGR